MTLRTIITIILIAISIPAMIVWKYLEGNMSDFNNWISGLDFPLNVQWVVKFAGIHVRDILLSWVIYRMSGKIRTIRVVAIVNLVYSVIDAILFIWSFNRGKDVLLVHYTITGVLSLAIVFWPKIIQAIRNKNKHTINYGKA